MKARAMLYALALMALMAPASAGASGKAPRVGFLAFDEGYCRSDDFNPEADAELTTTYLRDAGAAAQTLGLEAVVVKAKGAADLERAFDEIEEAGAQAVLILPYIAFIRDAQEIADVAKWHELPSIHFLTRYSALGGLMSYGPDFGLLQRRAAVYVDKVLNGANPSELPIEQPTRFEFSVNLETARELGLAIPQSLLVRADKVIE